MIQRQSKDRINKILAIVDGHQGGLESEIYTRLARRNWSVGLETASVTDLFSAIYRGKVDGIIFKDSQALPVSLLLRYQIADPIAILMPTLAIYDQEHERDQNSLRTLGEPTLISSSANTVSFISEFEWMVRKWQTGAFNKLGRARMNIVSGKVQVGLKAINALMEHSELCSLVVICLAKYLRKQKNIIAAEKILLTALKNSSKGLGVVLSLVDLYLSTGMPDTALHFLKSAKARFGYSKAILIDFIQAYVLINEPQKILEVAEVARKENFLPEVLSQFVARLYYAGGNVSLLRELPDLQKINADAFEKEWASTLVS